MNATNNDDQQAIAEARSHLGSRVIPREWTAKVHRHGDQITVTFEPPYVFLPANSHACYSVSVRLPSGYVSAFTQSNPRESVSPLVESPCYVPSRNDRRKIRFVARAIRKATGYDFLKESPCDEMRITEEPDRYRVDLTTPDTHYFQSVIKSTGAIEDEGHGHFIQPPVGPFEQAGDTDVLDLDDFNVEMDNE
ncbi:MAG: hypothetical protein ACOC8L_15415 [Spirochaetota bacterium]